MGKHLNNFQSGKSQGILNRLEKSWNFTQNIGKVREFQPSFHFYFFVDFLMESYLLQRFLYYETKQYQNTGKWTKYWKSQGNLSVRKCGNYAIHNEWCV